MATTPRRRDGVKQAVVEFRKEVRDLPEDIARESARPTALVRRLGDNRKTGGKAVGWAWRLRMVTVFRS